MVFSNFSRSEVNNQIIFRNITPILNVDKLNFYKDDSSGNFIKKEFRWSFNKEYWAGWTTLDQGNISSIDVNKNVNLFIEIRYSLSSSAKVNSFSIDYSQTVYTPQVNPTPTPKPVVPITQPTVTKSGKEITFNNFSRAEAGNEIIFKNSTSLKYVLNLKYYSDNASGVFLKKQFRWSFNNSYWSAWEDLNIGNISNIKINNNSNLYFEIKYTKAGSTPNVTTFSITYIQGIGTDTETTPVQPLKPTPIIPEKPKSEPCPIDYGGSASCEKPAPINADYLNGKDGNFYLYRPNHKGEQSISTITNLTEILESLSKTWYGFNVKDALNVDGPGVGVYYGNNDGSIYFKTIINGNKLFITEDSSGHITLDVDDASINELYTLIGTISGINVGSTGQASSGEVFKQTSGSSLEFRSVVGGTNNVQVTTVGDQIKISIVDVSGGYPIWIDTDPVSADVGGIQGGDDVSLGTNSIELLERILYEYFPPNIVNLSPLSGYYEKYVNNFDVSFYGNFNNDNFVKTKIYKAEVLINNTPDIAYPSINYPNVNSGTFNWVITGPSLYEDRNYKVNIYNHSGSIEYPIHSESIDIKFVNPYFYGIVGNEVTINNITSNIITNLNRLIVPEQTNGIEYDVSANYVKLKFVYAYDNNYAPLKNIFDIKNNFNVTTSFESGVKLINNGSQTNIPYRVYIKSHWISFNQDVSVFKLIFNI